ncbi:hypothetical protein Cpir12675_001742 [Ceratocystis pirilliformis]|uniref:ubiquitinyl hydrolase 1 n=1 Tax=Ceratocystis pirilliformis TaxID=259994 RepID=A0ABR3ZEB3_9PEZI
MVQPGSGVSASSSASVSASASASASTAPIVVSSNSPNVGNANHGSNAYGTTNAGTGPRRRGPNNHNHGNYYHHNQQQMYHHQHQHQNHHHHQNQNQHQHHQHQHQQPMAGPYGPYTIYNQQSQYYQHIPQYQNPMMHHGSYMPYHPHQTYSRPQPIQPFAPMAPMASIAASPAYPRPTPSPSLATPYQPPPMPQTLQQPQTPSSVHDSSHHGLTPPLSSTRDFTPGVPFFTDNLPTHPAPIVSSDAPAVVVSSQPYSSYPSAPPSVSSAVNSTVPSVVASASPFPPSTTVTTSAPPSAPAPVSVPVDASSNSPMATSAKASVTSQILDSSVESLQPKFHIPVPWLSCSESEWPLKAPRSRRRRRAPLQDGAELLRQHVVEPFYKGVMPRVTEKQVLPSATTEHAPPMPATPSVKNESVINSPPIASSDSTAPVQIHHTKAAAIKTAKPVVPVVPVVPKTLPRDVTKDNKLGDLTNASSGEKSGSQNSASLEAVNGQISNNAQSTVQENAAVSKAEAATPTSSTAEASAPASAPAPAKPVNWASLLKKSFPKGPTNSAEPAPAATGTRMAAVIGVPVSNGVSTTFSKEKTSSLADALRSFTVDGTNRIAFLEPRGLVNGGNMCYMNSILQVLLHCIPFYDFLDQVSKKATHSFNKSETPLIDAMIMFIQEFRVTASAPTAEKLYETLRSKERQFGEPFSPTFLYDEMKSSKRFANMEQGHQQDAEEFLGLLLQVLDDECTKVLATSNEPLGASNGNVSSNEANSVTAVNSGDDWMEVGPRQKAAVSRVTGQSSSSPISRIFGGYVRSELLKPGLKPSLTTQFYQSLQLDIDVPHIVNILDALKHMARKEVVIVDSAPSSAKNEKVCATTQTLICNLPPILVLHLKRFQFDAEGGTVKLWKNVGYPLELEIPRESLARQMLARLASEGQPLPKYRLSAVVYHHGKNASVGHYTVDVRRQDAREWIHIDDTKIEPIRTEEVAYAGLEGEGGHATSSSSNRFGLMDGNGGTDDDQGWKQVTSPANGNKRYSSTTNSAAVATAASASSTTAASTAASAAGTNNGNSKMSAFRGKQSQQMLNDSKVAYILFYQRV